MKMYNLFNVIVVISLCVTLFAENKKQIHRWFCPQGTWEIKKNDTTYCLYHNIDDECFIPIAPLTIFNTPKTPVIKSVHFNVQALKCFNGISFGISLQSGGKRFDIILKGTKVINRIITYSRSKNISEIFSVNEIPLERSIKADSLWHAASFMFEEDGITIYYDDSVVGTIKKIDPIYKKAFLGVTTLHGITYFKDIRISDGEKVKEILIKDSEIIHIHIGEESENTNDGIFQH